MKGSFLSSLVMWGAIYLIVRTMTDMVNIGVYGYIVLHVLNKGEKYTNKLEQEVAKTFPELLHNIDMNQVIREGFILVLCLGTLLLVYAIYRIKAKKEAV